MYSRRLSRALLDALSFRPVVFLNGARQTGKTTLVRDLLEEAHPASFVTLDDAGQLAAAEADAADFVASFPGPVIIDEVQRAPDLLLAIKAAVDRQREPGRFLLTGSADILLLPRIADALAGRMQILTLWPLCQAEIEGTSGTFVDCLYEASLPIGGSHAVDDEDVVARLLRGGYPEVVQLADARHRKAWFEAYTTTILHREVRDIIEVESLGVFPRLMTLLASRLMTPLNYADLARTLGIPQTTLKRYVALLETTFVAQVLPAWFVNIGKRVAKAPKVHIVDTGLAAALTGVDRERLRGDRSALGPLLETFVVTEVRKLIGWSRARPALHHFRTHQGVEVDLVLDDPGAGIVGIEVKAARTIGAGDFAGLRLLSEAAKDRFHRGVLLYTGADVIAFGERMHAIPVSALWEW